MFKRYGKNFKRRDTSHEEDDDPFGFGFLDCGVLALFPTSRS
jgi:hypothetical protein